jgi:hypothetical protein
VYSVAGVDVTNTRVGYSSQGPGRLSTRKPDISAYTHFRGSDVYPNRVDGGTSAACPVAAGVVAAIRSRYPVGRISPFQLRALISKTAIDLGGLGFDYDHGWGVINAAKVVSALIAALGAVAGQADSPVERVRKPRANGRLARKK